MDGVHSLKPGTIVGRNLEIEHVLGAGGFGVTYRALDHTFKRHVAIKEYFPRNASVRASDGTVQVVDAKHEALFRWGLDRFVEEAQTLARFSHANIVRVVQIFAGNGTGYIVLEFVDGPSLKEWLARSGPPQQAELDAFAAALLSALKMVHRNDILHRDLAPKNVLLRADGSPVVVDFGSARQVVSAKSMPVTALVTPHYAPYEQYLTSGQGQGPWTDIYATAAMLYEIITGKPPPEAPSRVISDTYEPIARHARGKYRDSFLKAVDWGLQPHPKERPQDIGQWRAMLLGEAAPESPVKGLNTAPRGERPARRIPFLDKLLDVARK